MSHIRELLGINRFDHPAFLGHPAEYFELAVPEIVGEIDDLQFEARIRFINAVAVHGFLKGDAFERGRDVHASGHFPDSFQQRFDEGVDILSVDERHFDVDLSELELSVGPLIFIAKTASELKIAFDAPNHENLLKLLW